MHRLCRVLDGYPPEAATDLAAQAAEGFLLAWGWRCYGRCSGARRWARDAGVGDLVPGMDSAIAAGVPEVDAVLAMIDEGMDRIKARAVACLAQTA